MEDKKDFKKELLEKIDNLNKEIKVLDYYDGSLVKDELMELIYRDIKNTINEIYKEALANNLTYKEIVELFKSSNN